VDHTDQPQVRYSTTEIPTERLPSVFPRGTLVTVRYCKTAPVESGSCAGPRPAQLPASSLEVRLNVMEMSLDGQDSRIVLPELEQVSNFAPGMASLGLAYLRSYPKLCDAERNLVYRQMVGVFAMLPHFRTYQRRRRPCARMLRTPGDLRKLLESCTGTSITSLTDRTDGETFIDRVAAALADAGGTGEVGRDKLHEVLIDSVFCPVVTGLPDDRLEELKDQTFVRLSDWLQDRDETRSEDELKDLVARGFKVLFRGHRDLSTEDRRAIVLSILRTSFDYAALTYELAAHEIWGILEQEKLVTQRDKGHYEWLHFQRPGFGGFPLMMLAALPAAPDMRAVVKGHRKTKSVVNVPPGLELLFRACPDLLIRGKRPTQGQVVSVLSGYAALHDETKHADRRRKRASRGKPDSIRLDEVKEAVPDGTADTAHTVVSAQERAARMAHVLSDQLNERERALFELIKPHLLAGERVPWKEKAGGDAKKGDALRKRWARTTRRLQRRLRGDEAADPYRD